MNTSLCNTTTRPHCVLTLWQDNIGDAILTLEKKSYQIAVSSSVQFKDFETEFFTTKATKVTNDISPFYIMIVPKNILSRTATSSREQNLWLSVVYLRIRSYDPITRVQGEWSTPTLPWTVAGSCANGQQYLNNTDMYPNLWECLNCKPGANCLRVGTELSPATAKDLVPLSGWWRVPWAEVPNSFAECMFEDDCIGFPSNGKVSNLTNSTARCEVGKNVKIYLDLIHNIQQNQILLQRQHCVPVYSIKKKNV